MIEYSSLADSHGELLKQMLTRLRTKQIKKYLHFTRHHNNGLGLLSERTPQAILSFQFWEIYY